MIQDSLGFFYLASASPRRRDLLNDLGLQFEVVLSRSPEQAHPQRIRNNKDLAIVMEIAEGKLRGAWETISSQKAEADSRQNGLILAADTLVFLGDEVLGKPKNAAEAKRTLNKLSGKEHTVATGISLAAIWNGELGEPENRMVTTTVSFLELSSADIEWYVKTGEPMDKAGAYGAQGIGAALLRGIQGSYTNVVGLPLAETVALISEVSGHPWQLWTKK